jgi:hypothetical protein
MFPTNYIASMMTLPDFAMYEADEAAKDFRPSAKEMFAK